MSDLAEFLRGRLDEDAVDATMRTIHREDCESVPDAEGYTYPCTCGIPDRLMREVEAKRRMIGRIKHDAYVRGGQDELHYDLCRLLALPYVDHPDYDERWRP